MLLQDQWNVTTDMIHHKEVWGICSQNKYGIRFLHKTKSRVLTHKYLMNDEI